jgi:protein ImuB
VLWIALELPALPLQIAERGGASREPLVISEGPEQRPMVVCANEAARAAGVQEGQAVAAAKALALDLRVVERDGRAEQEALERLAAWASQFTPMSCLDGRGIVLEIESTLRLFDGHAKLSAAIRQGVHELGFHAALGVAPTPLAARLFARARARGLQVRSCLDLPSLRERVGDLPLFLLDWPAETLAHLTDLGVVRMRDMLQLPTEGVARRFGQKVAIDLGRLMGVFADPREAYVPPPRLRSRLELPAQADGVEALAFPLRRMLAEMEGALRGRGAGVQQLTLWLEHGRKQRTRVDLEFASPEREADFILSIAREKLGRLTLRAATIALDLRADALLAFTPRESTWLPGAREQALGRERLIQRLSARLGHDRVFGIAIGDDHRPERTQKTVPGRLFDSEETPPGTVSSRPAWLLNRPQRLVTQDGRPSYQGTLRFIAGPERVESGWWDTHEVRRDYYVAANERGETFWIFREHRGDQAWYLHGVFA